MDAGMGILGGGGLQGTGSVTARLDRLRRHPAGIDFYQREADIEIARLRRVRY